jgi:hypothetical protein
VPSRAGTATPLMSRNPPPASTARAISRKAKGPSPRQQASKRIEQRNDCPHLGLAILRGMRPDDRHNAIEREAVQRTGHPVVHLGEEYPHGTLLPRVSLSEASLIARRTLLG